MGEAGGYGIRSGIPGSSVREALRSLLVRHEGLRLKPYRCTAGRITIGVGRNIEDVGITKDEAFYLLENDISRIEGALTHTYPWFQDLAEARQDVLISMVFQLGISRFFSFTKFLFYVEAKQYYRAAEEMRNSKWAEQTPTRVAELAVMMRTGLYMAS